MNIVFCLDNNLIKQAIILIKSIIATNSSENIQFFALLLKVDRGGVDALQMAVSNKATLTVYEMQNELNALTVSSNRLTVGTYLRFFIEKKLPISIKKVLYLDCDIIVVASLKELYEIDISDYSLAAAFDVECDDICRYNRLDYPLQDGYFNAGVMLINLEYWRNHSISEKALNFICENPKACIFQDQDALNHLLHGTVKFISNRYNVIYDFFRIDSENLRIEKNKYAVIKKDLQNPVIIHYAGVFKPWNIEYHRFNYPFSSLYSYYANLKDVNLTFLHWKSKKNSQITLKQILRKIFVVLHILSSDAESKRKNYEDISKIESTFIH